MRVFRVYARRLAVAAAGAVATSLVMAGGAGAANADELPYPVQSWWELDGTGMDAIGDADLTLMGQYGWTDGWEWAPDGALDLPPGGGGYAETAGPVLATDESFSVMAWVKLADRGTDQVVLAQAGANRSAFQLRYSAASDRWEMAVPKRPRGSSWSVARSAQSPSVDEWTHLAAIYDRAAREVRLYVDGRLQEAVTRASAFNATGPFLIGADGRTCDGWRGSHFEGAVDMVIAFSGVVPDRLIADIGGSGMSTP